MAAGLLLAAVLWSPVAAAAPPILRCPKTTGLCQWKDDGWAPYWSAGTSEQLVDFVVFGDRVVVLLRGHMSSGRLIVLDGQGKSLLVRHLATARNLASVIGEGPWGLLLCNGTIGTASCETWLPEEPSSKTPRTPWLPDNCLFPRFANNDLFCVEEGAKTVLRSGRSMSASGLFGRIPLTFDGAQWMEDLHPLGGNRFLVQADQKLFFLDADGEAHQISDGQVDWSQEVAMSRVLFPQCWVNEEMELTRCALSLTDSGGNSTEIWSSDHFWPVELAELDESRYLVQLASDEEDAVVLLRLKEGEWSSRIIWRDDKTPMPAPKVPNASS